MHGAVPCPGRNSMHDAILYMTPLKSILCMTLSSTRRLTIYTDGAAPLTAILWRPMSNVTGTCTNGTTPLSSTTPSPSSMSVYSIFPAVVFALRPGKGWHGAAVVFALRPGNFSDFAPCSPITPSPEKGTILGVIYRLLMWGHYQSCGAAGAAVAFPQMSPYRAPSRVLNLGQRKSFILNM